MTTPHLITEFILNVTFHSPQHKRLQDRMKTTELVLVEPAALILRGIFNILGEPFIELVMRIEQAGHDEVQQGPQL